MHPDISVFYPGHNNDTSAAPLHHPFSMLDFRPASHRTPQPELEPEPRVEPDPQPEPAAEALHHPQCRCLRRRRYVSAVLPRADAHDSCPRGLLLHRQYIVHIAGRWRRPRQQRQNRQQRHPLLQQ